MAEPWVAEAGTLEGMAQADHSQVEPLARLAEVALELVAEQDMDCLFDLVA